MGDVQVAYEKGGWGEGKMKACEGRWDSSVEDNYDIKMFFSFCIVGHSILAFCTHNIY